MANYATHPALAVPHGFDDAGLPGSMTFLAKPFGETELLAVAKAYQDLSGHHLRHPTLEAVASSGGR
jgi:Asp-tRNA(Asn)/Glu-tRNA(Gln) amidotransferase A subunit family amidase